MNNSKRILQCILCVVSVVFWYGIGIAQHIVEAKYNEPRGLVISWQVDIPSPAPSAVIVLQYIPVGTKVVAASPPLQSHDIQSGLVKWLLAKTSPGSITMSMTLDKPIQKKGEIHGKIIFQEQRERASESIFMAPSSRTNKKMAIEGC